MNRLIVYCGMVMFLSGCLDQGVIKQVGELGLSAEGAGMGEMQLFDAVVDMGAHVAGRLSDPVSD